MQDLTGRLRRAAARRLRHAGRRSHRALRLDRARPLPVPHPAGPQGADRRDRRGRQPLARRLRDAGAVRAVRGRADLLHRRRHSDHRFPFAAQHQGGRRGIGRPGVPRLERREDRARSRAGSKKSCARSTSSPSAAIRRSLPASTARSKWPCSSPGSPRGRFGGISRRSPRSWFATTQCFRRHSRTRAGGCAPSKSLRSRTRTSATRGRPESHSFQNRSRDQKISRRRSSGSHQSSSSPRKSATGMTAPRRQGNPCR